MHKYMNILPKIVYLGIKCALKLMVTATSIPSWEKNWFSEKQKSISTALKIFWLCNPLIMAIWVKYLTFLEYPKLYVLISFICMVPPRVLDSQGIPVSMCVRISMVTQCVSVMAQSGIQTQASELNKIVFCYIKEGQYSS